MNEDLLSSALHAPPVAVPDCTYTATTDLNGCGEKVSSEGYFIASQDGHNFTRIPPDSIKDLLTQHCLVYYVDELPNPLTADWVHLNNGTTSQLLCTFPDQAHPTDSISVGHLTQQQPAYFNLEDSSAPTQAFVTPLQNEVFGQLSLDGARLPVNNDNSVSAVVTQASARTRNRSTVFRLCQVCGIHFPSKKLYDCHMNIHEFDRPFKCSSCDHTFNHDVNRVIHEILQHDYNTPPYNCPICSVNSSRWSSFKFHLLQHQLDDAVVCPVCSKSFESQCLVDAHMRTEHPHSASAVTTSSYNCRLCLTVLPTVGKLRQHYCACHPNERKCRRISREAVYEPQITDSSTSFVSTASPSEARKPRLSKLHARTFLKNTLSSGKTKKPTTFDGFIKQLEVEQLPLETLEVSTKRCKGGRSKVPRLAYSCSICKKKFTKTCVARRHALKHVNEKPFQCALCHRKFTQKSAAKSHVMMHHQLKHRPSCPFCHRQFRGPAILAKHVRSRHGITSYTYPPPDQLNANSVVENFVTTEPQPQADTTTAYSHVISASTNVAATLFNSGKAVENTSESMFLKLSDVSYSCVTNPAITSDPGDTAYRPYKCSLCAKSFFSRATLSVHMLRHSDSPLPHVCHFCPLRFATSSDLTHHVRSHSPRRRLRLARQMAQSASPLKWNNFSQCFLSTRRCRSDRSFKCSLCPRSYRHLIHLNYHVRQSHCPDQAPFECDKCAKRFVNDRRLTRHVQKAHASPTSQSKLTCSVCTSHFATVSSLKRHMVIHSDSKPYKCHICHKMFKFHSSCVKHIKTHSSSVVDLDELPHQSDVVQFCPTSGECTSNLPATDGELVHQPKHSYTYAYFTDVQHEMSVRSTNATRYQTTRNVADGTGLERGIIRDWSDSLLYDPSLFPGNDDMIIHPTDKAPTHCYSNLDPVNTETIITGHAVSGGAHTLSQYADCKHSETRGCPTGAFGTVSTNERREHMIPSVSGTVLYDTATVPVGHRLDLPEDTADSYNLVHPPIDSTKETVVPGSHFNFCRLNPAPACPSFSDATVRSSVMNACEPNQSSQSFLLFGCGVCDASFEFPQSLAMHVQSNHSIRPKPFHCDTCGSCFASETLLIIHKREHSDVSATEISCPSCPLLEFGNKSALTRHVLLCHPLPTKDRFRCTHCNTRFRLLRSLKTHVAGLGDAAEQRRNESSVIEQSLKQVLTRRRKRLRERVHVIEPALLRSVTQKAHLPQECLILSEKYLLSCVRDLVTNSENNTKPSSPERNTAVLNQDVDESHIRVKRHLCPTCGRSFVSVSGLKHHTRAHLGIRPYKCTECGEQFTKNCLLQKHIIRTHTIQQPGDANLSSNPQEASLRSPACLVGFRCHLCDRTLWSKNSLRCHVRRHAASRAYKCIYCRARFTTWSQRQNHLHVCREFNDNIQEPPPTFRDRRTAVGSNVDRSVTDMTFPQAPEIGLPDNMPVTGGDSSSSVPLMTSFLTEDGNQVLSLPVGANILIPVQVKEDPHTHPEWTSSILPSQVLFPGLYLAPFGSETDTFGSSEAISVVELSQTPSFVQTSLEPSTTVEVVDQPNSVLGSYHEAICCQSCHNKFPDNRAYFKHHCAKIALLHTMSPNPNAETNANVISRGRRRGVRPKRATSPGAGRSFRALHKCATCSRVFPQAYLLKRHERTHTNCRPFVCRFCGAGFSQSYSLTTHELIHSDAKPYTCTQCDRGFRQKSNLHRHIRLMHSSETD